MNQKVINLKKEKKKEKKDVLEYYILYRYKWQAYIYIYIQCFNSEKFKRLCDVHVCPFLTKRLLISMNEILLSDNLIRVL